MGWLSDALKDDYNEKSGDLKLKVRKGRKSTGSASSVDNANLMKAAQRRTDKASGLAKKANANAQTMAGYRRNRIEKKDFKGKYYGPDAFKGDLKLLSEWRASGSPKNTKKFANKRGVNATLNTQK